MTLFEKIKNFIDHNRFFVLGPIICLLIWIGGVNCTPTTADPLDQSKQVTPIELKMSFTTWQADQQKIAALFEIAGEDIKQQQERNEGIKQFLISLASADFADLPSLITLLLSGGGIGAIVDNIRKNGVIGGLKRNK